LHSCTDIDEVVRVVGVPGDIAITVIDLDRLAVTKALLGPRHHALRHGNDLRAFLAGKIESGVESRPPGERICAVAEIG